MADEFTGDSGLKDDWDGVITDSVWMQNTDRGNWYLQLVSKADDGEDVDHGQLSVGGADKGWVSYDREEMQNEGGEGKKFHTKSALQQFINVVMETEAADVLRERSRELYGKRGPMFANLWVGLKFHWDVVTEQASRMKKESGAWEDVEIQVMRPTRFLGVVELSKGSVNPQPVQQSQTSPAASNGGIPIADLATLKKLALEHEDWNSFADAVMGAQSASGESLTKNPEIRKMVSKKDSYGEVRAQLLG
jgi:hypothetical protein